MCNKMYQCLASKFRQGAGDAREWTNVPFSGVIFKDLQKAFDTVDHEILIATLRVYGVEGVEFDWFVAYQGERKQCCKVNGTII